MIVDRDIWVINHLKELKGDLLDVGAGEQPFRKHCSHLRYYSHDFCKYDGNGDGTGLQFDWDYGDTDYVSDITDIDVDDESFDVVLCTDVLEHVPDPVFAIRELRRVLKIGGTLLITTPYASLSHMAPQHYFPGFTKHFYEHHLKGCEVTSNANYYEYFAQECALNLRKEFSTYLLSERDKVTINRMRQLLHRMGDTLDNNQSPLHLGLYVKYRKV